MTVTLSTSPASPGTTDADALVIGVIQSPDGPSAAPGADAVGEALGDLTGTLTALGATGEPEELTKIPSGGRLPAGVVLAVGLGPAPAAGAFDTELLRRAAGAAIRELNGNKRSVRSENGRSGGKRVAVALPARDPAEAEAVATGALLGGYAFRRYRSGGPTADTEVILLTGAGNEAAVRRARVLARAVTLARDLVNTPPGDLSPADLAGEASRVGAASGVEVQVLDEKELAAGGFGGILAVGQGSARPPRLVRLEYSHPGAAKTVVFAGKGITFDSGGLSLKPPKSMETMKSDMGGAAAVLAAVAAVAELGLPVNVVGYMPLAENMPGGAAQRPSDVITIHGGKTVEVLNTDAEGRLVLADVLARSADDHPDLLVDVATLTGAQVVALGRRTAGVMGSAEEVASAVATAMREAGEPAWPMPLPAELRKGLDSTVADLTNVAPDRNGGMLVAGLFLREFVPEGVAWAHLDIAGPAFNDGSAYGYTPKGGTGAAARALVQIAAEVADGRLPGG
ncbi:MAG: leucyl aminopeptidase [Streptosporangiaceae bacterium]|nr:leucyl aminopeptidase [Streptosporangiaceae bacterium]